MGLDMYLEVRKYVSLADWVQENGEVVKKPVQVGLDVLELAGLSAVASGESYGVSISATAIYWRKANAIHKWFVDTLAKGVDECQDIYVERKDLETLRNLVSMVVASKNVAVAQEHLPTTSGFFFGNTDYDEWYWYDMEYTLKELNRVLAVTDNYETNFVYRASW
jgi:hypothetical protein